MSNTADQEKKPKKQQQQQQQTHTHKKRKKIEREYKRFCTNPFRSSSSFPRLGYSESSDPLTVIELQQNSSSNNNRHSTSKNNTSKQNSYLKVASSCCAAVPATRYIGCWDSGDQATLAVRSISFTRMMIIIWVSKSCKTKAKWATQTLL